MHLFDTPAGFEDPLEMLLGCHRRIEKQLATLGKLPVYLAANGVDPEASSAAQAVLRYFAKAAPHHHEDEEKDLFPLLERRITDPAQLQRFRELRARLEADHEEMLGRWPRLRKSLEGIAEGLPSPLAADEVEAFRAIYARHIPLEEAAFPELFARWVREADRHALGRAMAARRGVAYPD